MNLKFPNKNYTKYRTARPLQYHVLPYLVRTIKIFFFFYSLSDKKYFDRFYRFLSDVGFFFFFFCMTKRFIQPRFKIGSVKVLGDFREVFSTYSTVFSEAGSATESLSGKWHVLWYIWFRQNLIRFLHGYVLSLGVIPKKKKMDIFTSITLP